jgi:hypothetical protein
MQSEHFNAQDNNEVIVEEVAEVNTRKKQEAVRSANPAAKKKQEEKPAEMFEIKKDNKSDEKPVDLKETKKEQSEIDDYEDNWDMSDHDLQDNSENK